MSIPDMDSLLKLDVETRLVLVQKLWDSIFQDAQDGAAMPVSPQERELGSQAPTSECYSKDRASLRNR
jgi:hypothetical protein